MAFLRGVLIYRVFFSIFDSKPLLWWHHGIFAQRSGVEVYQSCQQFRCNIGAVKSWRGRQGAGSFQLTAPPWKWDELIQTVVMGQGNYCTWKQGYKIYTYKVSHKVPLKPAKRKPKTGSITSRIMFEFVPASCHNPEKVTELSTKSTSFPWIALVDDIRDRWDQMRIDFHF